MASTAAFVTYFRVSTAKQGASGLGLEAQQAAVAGYLSAANSRVVAEFTEVESGKNSNRPELLKALHACRLYGAKLVIAKLDRLSRDAYFLLGLEKAGVDFIAADMPNANRLTVGIMAMVADEERRMISSRTIAALAAAKARGTKLGGNRGASLSSTARHAGRTAMSEMARVRANDLSPIINELRAEGLNSASSIARALTERGVPTARGHGKWSPVQVTRALARLTP